MSKDYSEDVALFTHPEKTYTGEARHHEREDVSSQEEDPAHHTGKDEDCTNLGGPPMNINNSDMTKLSSGSKPDPDEPSAIPPFDQVLCDAHEKAMVVVGFGKMQYCMYVALGMAFMGDGSELLLMAYILPGAERDYCMTSPMKGWLGAIGFAGMLFGANTFGMLGDKVGRKPILISSLMINIGFAIVGAFMPGYWFFLVCRFLSGFGIGGSIPLVLAYGSELSPQSKRGWHLGSLMAFWAFGGLYTAVLGWIIVPNHEISFILGGGFVFSSWRVFILICILPVTLGMICLLPLPESPRFLLQVGRDIEAMAVYRRIYMWNHSEAGTEYEMPEIEIISSKNAIEMEKKDFYATKPAASAKCHACMESFFQLFYSPLTTITFLLSIIWFSLTFGYYGVSIWFPEYMKRMEQAKYFSQTNHTDNAFIANKVYKTDLDNIEFTNTTFLNVNFTDMEMLHIKFTDCLLNGCQFINVTAKQTYIETSIIMNSLFRNTNFYPFKFQETVLDNTTFTEVREGCQVDFEVNYSERTVFLEAFISQLVVVPAVLLSSFMVDVLGRVKVLVFCLFISGLSVFFFWLLTTEISVVCLNAVFNCFVSASFNAMEITTVELYPTHLRATGFGFLSSLGRIASILGNVTFGNLIDVNKAIPILITAAILGIGGIMSIKLPESKSKNL